MMFIFTLLVLPTAHAAGSTDSATCIVGCHAQGHCCAGVPPAGGQVVSECQQPSCAMGCLIGTISTSFNDCTATCHAHSPQNNCSFNVGKYSFNTCESCPSSCGGVQPDCGGSDSVDGCLLGCRLAYQMPSPAITEPYPPLSHDNPTGNPAVPESPDPLVRMTWDAAANKTNLQVYTVPVPTVWTPTPAASFSNLGSLSSSRPKVTVNAPGALRLDFAVEHPGWFEFESPNLGIQAHHVRASISEYNEPWPGKTRPVTVYGNGTYRLETNSQLYEGARYAWIIVDPAPDGTPFTPWEITAVRLVVQTKPVSYTGSFKSADKVITGSWYSGAYGSRTNMMPDAFNSILMDRGDRVSIQGDGHPTMAAALVAFGGAETFDLVHTMLNKTDSGCAGCHVIDDGIMPYPIYWGMSVNDWYLASGDTAKFVVLAPDVGHIIDKAVASFLKPGLNIGWFGWDDRIANGFCGTCNMEAQLAFASLVVRACGDFANSLSHAGDSVNATRYTATAQQLAKTLRARKSVAGGPWYADYGLHASAYLINAKIVATKAEAEILFARNFNDSVKICSWSPFNQYWILQALGNMQKMDYAAASIRLCWGPMLTLGNGCFWELFSPEWTRFMAEGDKAPTRPSYCHPWASGVTHWLTKSMAGVAAWKPGYQQYTALPYVSASAPTVNATVPTKHGPIVVGAAMNAVHGTVVVEIDAHVSGLVGLQRMDEATGCTLNLSSVLVDGAAAGDSSSSSGGSSNHPTSMASYDAAQLPHLHPTVVHAHAFVSVSAGKHTVSASFEAACVARVASAAIESAAATSATAAAAAVALPSSGGADSSSGKGLPSAPPFPPAAYPGSWVTDATTRGDWVGKYGTDGYQLFAFKNGTDVVKLPPYVGSVSLFKGTSTFVGADAGNATYLEDPAEKQHRALGFTTAGADGSQGTVIDIAFTDGKEHTVSLYMVGSSGNFYGNEITSTKQAIRVMELVTFDPIAPDPVFEKFESGVYWSLTYASTNGIRLRVMPIDNEAGFAAVFFDPPQK